MAWMGSDAEGLTRSPKETHTRGEREGPGRGKRRPMCPPCPLGTGFTRGLSHPSCGTCIGIPFLSRYTCVFNVISKCVQDRCWTFYNSCLLSCFDFFVVCKPFVVHSVYKMASVLQMPTFPTNVFGDRCVCPVGGVRNVVRTVFERADSFELSSRHKWLHSFEGTHGT